MRRLSQGTKLVVASHNKGKVWEINQLLAPYGLSAVSAGELGLVEPDETEATFEGNALIKARAAADSAALPALADDSGLEIDALGGAPGVYSADWAGPGKDFGLAMRRVHEALEQREAWNVEAVRANFISVLCLAWPGGEHRFFVGRVHGHIVWPPRGGNGFGYDPIFLPDGHDQTFGEMEPKAKYAISHRTRAFASFQRDCLEAAVTETPMNVDRDMAGLAAAAANISTRAELVVFIGALRAHLARADQTCFFDDGLAILEQHFAQLGENDEPRWRTMAKALLAPLIGIRTPS